MASFRSILVIFSLLFIVISVTEALYEDQIGKFDWKRSFIGKVKTAKFNDNYIVAVTEGNVLACLNSDNGMIVWRQLLEDFEESRIHLLHVDREVSTVSGTKNNWFVRGWDLSTGILLWEWTVYSEPQENFHWFVKNQQLINVVPKIASLEVTIYELKTGENSGKTTRISTPFLTTASKCIITSSYFSCISNGDGSGYLYYLDVLSNSNKIFTRTIESLIGSGSGSVEIASLLLPKPVLLLQRNNIARIVVFEGDEVRPKFDIVPNAVGSSSGDENRIYQLDVNRNNVNKVIVLRSQNLDSYQSSGSSQTIDYPLGLGAPLALAADCTGMNCGILLRGSDNSLTLIDVASGRIRWTREEALSDIVATEFFELPVSELDASIENEFKTSSNDILSMLLHRLSTQTKQLTNFLFGSHQLEENRLVRDEFGLHKMIVVATSVGKLFGIDTLTGTIIWSYRLPNVRPFKSLNMETMLLFVQRTARYAPFSAQAVLLAQDAQSGNGVLFQFDPITGLSGDELQHLDYRIKQALLLPHVDDEYLKPLVVVSSDDRIDVYPKNANHLVWQHASGTYLYTIDPSVNMLKGYNLVKANVQLQIRLMWEMSLGTSQLVSIGTRPPSERVHSQGRVLSDRSVYYKYVNPNLIALATLSDDPLHKHVLSVYLIDGVTGLILYSTSHRRAKGPVHLVHSENWLVYSFFSERFRRHEIAAAELFEGHIQSNSTAFSSHAVSQLPHVQTQSYIMPTTPLTMAVTQTERGITNKFLLIALSNGGVSEIPWMLLQPRFSDACGPEESCIPYMPEIPLPPEATINYNQTLGRIKGIEVAPARLESTIHVLVHGLDLFYTRVAPSKTFDVLKEDFDHRLIVFVLGGLILASYITKHLASKKALRQAWK